VALAALVDRDALADRVVAVDRVVLAGVDAVRLVPADVFAAAARVAAGLVVACFAAAIVVLLLPLLAGVRGLWFVRSRYGLAGCSSFEAAFAVAT